MTDQVSELVSEFGRVFGKAPVGVWMAPGRVNLIGEHIDYNAGSVLPLALAERTCVALAPSSRGETRLSSLQAGGDVATFHAATTTPGGTKGWAAYVAGSFWALREAGHPVTDYDVLITSDVPIGAGLSSSAALECAVGTALADVGAMDLSPTELAQLMQRAENDYVGAPTGIMDQMASLHGLDGQLVLIDTRSLQVRYIPFALAEHGLELLIVNTHSPHSLVDGQYAARRATCAAAAHTLGVEALCDLTPDALPAALARLDDEVSRKRVRHVVNENARVVATATLLESGADPREIGSILTASHESLRDDYQVSVDQVDIAVDSALRAGAHGARITGGGFGGCVIALVDADDTDGVFAAIAAAYTANDFDAPSCLVARPSSGATRLH